MFALKACSPGGVWQQLSQRLLFPEIKQGLQHQNASICHILKSFPSLGTFFINFRFDYNDSYCENTRNGTFCSKRKLQYSEYGDNSINCEILRQGITIEKYFSKILNFLNNSISSHCKINDTNMSKVEAMAQLENNAQTADNLIQEIYSKLAVLQNCNPEFGAEAQKLIQENNALKEEVRQWKELLLLQQIKNGGNPNVRDPRLLERSAVVASSDSVKQEAPQKQAAQTAQAEVKSEPDTPQQQSGKKGKNKGGDGKAAAAPGGGGAPKGGKPKAGGDQAAAPDSQGNEEVDVGRLDLRIGLIKECSKHPDADSLYVEKIDVGEPNVRTVISGLVKHVPIDAMQNRMVVVLCNLKPSKMRGIMSEAMVMCASSPEKVEILTPPSGSAPGDVIEVDGYTRRPDAVLNPKKKIFETVAPDLKTNNSKQATYKGVPWTVPGKGFVVAESLVNVNVK